MAMNAAGRVADLIGLDEETVKTQILPALDTFRDARALSNHLEGLLGFSPAATAFTHQYVQARFPPARATASVSRSSVVPTHSPSSSSAKDETAPRKGKKEPKPKFPPAASAPRVVAGHSLAARGQAYLKGEREQESFLQPARAANKTVTNGGSGRSARGSPHSSSALGTQAPSNLAGATVGARVGADAGSGSASRKQDAQTGEDDDLPELAPSSEMIALDEAIAKLRVDTEAPQAAAAAPTSSSSIDRRKKRRTERPCFCHARVHPVHPHVPQCTACGLIICTAMTALVFSASSSCPSCAAPLLSDAKRAALLSTLSASRELLADAQRARQLRVREERRRAREDQRAARPAEELFPELAVGSGLVRSNPRPVDIAMGRAVVPDAQRKAKVLTLNAKTHKLKAAKPKSKKVKAAAETGSGAKEGPNVAKGASTAQSLRTAATAQSATSVRMEKEPQEGPEGMGFDSSSLEEEEEEEEYDANGVGLVADPDDDGFSMHGLVGAPLRVLPIGSASDPPSWWGLAPTLEGQASELRYVPVNERCVWGAQKAQAESEEQQEKRQKEEEEQQRRKERPGSERSARDRPAKQRRKRQDVAVVGALSSV